LEEALAFGEGDRLALELVWLVVNECVGSSNGLVEAVRVTLGVVLVGILGDVVEGPKGLVEATFFAVFEVELGVFVV
jgi:hypothetical protein